MTASEFREFKKNLGYEYPECFETVQAHCSTQDVTEKMMESFSQDDILKVTFQLASGMFSASVIDCNRLSYHTVP